MNGAHAIGSGPAIGDHVTVTHEASGSVVHGTVRLRPGIGLVVDADGCVVDLDREGWHCTSRDVEPPIGAVVIDRDGDAWQRRGAGWVTTTPGFGPRGWGAVRGDFGPLELVWETSC